MKLKLHIFVAVLQQQYIAHDQRFCCSIHRQKNVYMCAFLNSYSRSRQTCVSFVLSVPLAFLLLYGLRWYFHLSFDAFAFQIVPTLTVPFFIYVFFEDKNDFLLFVHTFQLMDTNIFLFSTSLLSSYLHSIDSMYEWVYNSKYYCTLFWKRFEFVNIMTLVAIDIPSAFTFQ